MFSALIIDADEEATWNIQSALRGYGFEFKTTSDAPEAMHLARVATPDIVFLRVELPTVSGFSVCNKLRRHDETKYIPLIIYASGVSDDVFTQHRGLKTRADDYLRLPFADGALITAVRGLIPLPEAQHTESHPLNTSEGFDSPVEDTGGVISDVDLSEFDEDYDYEDPDSVDPDIAKETDAAFDALVDDDPPTNSQTFVDTAEHPEGHTYSVTLDDVSSSPPELSVLSQAYDRSERLTIAAETMSDDDNVGSGLHSVDAGTSSGANDFKAKREVLALKTQLNAKKRELLGLRDELEARDRAILDAKHKNRELMAQLSDIEEKLLGAEEQLITAREEADAIKRDHATVTQREDGLKGRLSQAQDRISELERKLQEQAQSHQHAEEIEQALKASRHETAMERERADALGSELEATKARISELEHAVTEARQQAETGVAEVREQAKRDEEAALASLAQEHQAELQFEENRHREELRRLQERLERDLQQLREQVEQHRHELGQRRDAERRAQQALAVALRVLDEPQAAQ